MWVSREKITKLSDRQNRSHFKNSRRVLIFHDSTQKTYVPIRTTINYEYTQIDTYVYELYMYIYV